jgi:hypothetical protein
VEITEEVKKLAFPSSHVHRLVNEISRAHSGRNGLEPLPRQEYCTPFNKSCETHPRAIAALVRFADEISETRARISEQMLHTVPTASRIYWEYANCISASVPEPENRRIVVNVDVQKDAASRLFPCNDLPARTVPNEQIALIEYVLFRLEKINNERAYCAPEFQDYARVDEIQVHFTMLQGTERLQEFYREIRLGNSGLQSELSYPDIRIVDAFFQHHPDWSPGPPKELTATKSGRPSRGR